ncbi:unnamed protein product [Ilex paraguariensis]|uniref:Uncharacterized protein n=1 Tax=Ilex paraguariensis TaxID=185542 RepID=A0ABC8SC37_9AQUA
MKEGFGSNQPSFRISYQQSLTLSSECIKYSRWTLDISVQPTRRRLFGNSLLECNRTSKSACSFLHHDPNPVSNSDHNPDSNFGIWNRVWKLKCFQKPSYCTFAHGFVG